MSNCIFEQDGENPNIKKCKGCGRIVKTSRKAEEIVANCKTFRGNSAVVLPTIVGPGIDEAMEAKVKKPFEMPPITTKVSNFLISMLDFVADPSFVTKEEYGERLKICNTCPFRVQNSCGKCGCNLSLKARGHAFHCPEKKWPGDK
jgi:hypothetical protein